MFVAAFYRRLTRWVIAILSQRPHPSGKSQLLLVAMLERSLMLRAYPRFPQHNAARSILPPSPPPKGRDPSPLQGHRHPIIEIAGFVSFHPSKCKSGTVGVVSCLRSPRRGRSNLSRTHYEDPAPLTHAVNKSRHIKWENFISPHTLDALSSYRIVLTNISTSLFKSLLGVNLLLGLQKQ